jgi:hypothetical protein
MGKCWSTCCNIRVLSHSSVSTNNDDVLYFFKKLEEGILNVFITKK